MAEYRRIAREMRILREIEEIMHIMRINWYYDRSRNLAEDFWKHMKRLMCLLQTLEKIAKKRKGSAL